MRVKYEEMLEIFKEILISRGLNADKAYDFSKVFADNSLDGIYTHGVNRFPRIVGYFDSGLMNPEAEAVCEMQMGALERWNGNQGFGPYNARKAMGRACELAKEYGLGLVALGNNNHWLRGGSYGWQAAEAGCISISWSNTTPNMPVWGGVDNKIGNNPLVIGVPRSNGQHVVVDCALSQFSFGKLEETRLKGQQLPVPGGYDEFGNITSDPAAVEKTKRVLPMGYWKGSGLSLVLDLIGTVLTNQHSVHTIGTFPEEVGLTQIMIAIDPAKANSTELTDSIVNDIINDIKTSIPISEDTSIRYPGEREFKSRKENGELGIPVIDEVWQTILALKK